LTSWSDLFRILKLSIILRLCFFVKFTECILERNCALRQYFCFITIRRGERGGEGWNDDCRHSVVSEYSVATRGINLKIFKIKNWYFCYNLCSILYEKGLTACLFVSRLDKLFFWFLKFQILYTLTLNIKKTICICQIIQNFIIINIGGFLLVYYSILPHYALYNKMY